MGVYHELRSVHELSKLNVNVAIGSVSHVDHVDLRYKIPIGIRFGLSQKEAKR